jgi:hypothetical protein
VELLGGSAKALEIQNLKQIPEVTIFGPIVHTHAPGEQVSA